MSLVKRVFEKEFGEYGDNKRPHPRMKRIKKVVLLWSLYRFV
jgi:hypothetical protein